MGLKRAHKIALIVLGVFAVLLAVGFISADVIVSRLVQREVNKSLANLPGCHAECGKIHVRFFSGTASVEDLRFTYQGEYFRKRDTVPQGINVHVERLQIGRLFYTPLLKKHIRVGEIRIVHPDVEVWVDEDHPENCFPTLHDAELEHAGQWSERVDLNYFRIKNASVRIHSVRSKLDVETDSCSVTLRHLAYADSVFSFCDSIYRVQIGHVVALSPDGWTRFDVHDIEHRDQGAFRIGATRIANTLSCKRMADITKAPADWMDMRIEEISTSPFNPIRKALAEDYTLESLKMTVYRAKSFRDERYLPKAPYPMPQEQILAVPVPFRIGRIDTKIRHMEMGYAVKDSCPPGELRFDRISLSMNNVTNRRGDTLSVAAFLPIDSGEVSMNMRIIMDKGSHIETDMHIENVDAGFLSSMIRPMAGVSFSCHLDTVDGHFRGDTAQVIGTYRMLYHGLNVEAHKEDTTAYDIATRNADLVNAVANSLLPKSNPGALDIHPRAYNVEYKRDKWLFFPMYILGPCVEGSKMTVLPAIYFSKEIKK